MVVEPPDRPAPVRLRSPLARALVPVLAGIVVIALIMLATWGMAVLLARGGAESTERLAPTRFRVGVVEDIARLIDEDGPLLFPGLNTTTGERTIVLDHDGPDETRGWKAFWAYPADRPSTCTVEQQRGTRTFVDCEQRRLDVTQLARPEGVRPVVENQRVLYVDLRGVATPTTGSA